MGLHGLQSLLFAALVVCCFRGDVVEVGQRARRHVVRVVVEPVHAAAEALFDRPFRPALLGLPAALAGVALLLRRTEVLAGHPTGAAGTARTEPAWATHGSRTVVVTARARAAEAAAPAAEASRARAAKATAAAPAARTEAAGRPLFPRTGLAHRQ